MEKPSFRFIELGKKKIEKGKSGTSLVDVYSERPVAFLSCYFRKYIAKSFKIPVTFRSGNGDDQLNFTNRAIRSVWYDTVRERRVDPWIRSRLYRIGRRSIESISEPMYVENPYYMPYKF